MKSDLSFSEFDEVPYEKWIEKIVKDLKGKPIENLNYKVDRDLIIDPFLLDSKEHHTFFDRSFERRQDFYTCSNANILEALNNGVESIGMNQEDLKGNLADCLKDVQTQFISVHFSRNNSNLDILNEYLEFPSSKLDKGSFSLNPLHALWSNEGRESETDFISRVKKFNDQFPNFKLLEIDSTYIENEGASITEQVGYLIAQAHESLNILLDGGFDLECAANLLHFKINLGTSYFSELAKIRSIRSIWAKILMDYGIAEEKVDECIYINSNVSFLQHSQMDENNNLLRSTTIAMSALLGGTNSLSLLPYDFSKYKETVKSLRLARNIQNLLIEESYLAFVNDPSKGSYSIEKLTEEICEKAWSIFEKSERAGGFRHLNHLEIVKTFNSNRALLLEDYRLGNKTLLGVNKYPPPSCDIKIGSLKEKFRISKEWEEKL